MLLELLLTPIIALLQFILNSLPLITLPISLIDGIGELLILWNKVNCFVPINYALLLFGAYWLVVHGKFLVFIGSWIYSKIPFI